MSQTLLQQLEESVKKVGGKVETTTTTKEETKQETVPQYKLAVDAFVEADANYRALEKCLLEGEFIPNMQVDGPHLKETYLDLIEQVKDALEQRNVKLKEAQDLLRQQVVLEVTKQRGWDGKPSELTCGPLSVSSVTNRWFDSGSLLDQARKVGLLDELLEATTLDKDGRQVKLVEQVWEVRYADVLTWLKGRKLDGIIKAAYDEKESTPQVKGAKILGFIGEVKKEK